MQSLRDAHRCRALTAGRGRAWVFGPRGTAFAAALSVSLPFSHQQFFEVLARYNEALWPAPVVLLALALGSAALVIAKQAWDRPIGSILALLWAWMAFAYHFAFFTKINPAAWLFGSGFALASYLFAKHASRGDLRFAAPGGARTALALLLFGYAFVGYPLVGWLAGQRYPQVPTFGLPCPTTIFTFGMLLVAKRPVPPSVFVVPFAWSIIATVAAFKLGVIQDLGLPAAALICAARALLGRAVCRPNSGSGQHSVSNSVTGWKLPSRKPFRH
jgi:hypothetical protein